MGNRASVLPSRCPVLTDGNRYVNYLDDGDFQKKETRNILKALRSNVSVDDLSRMSACIQPFSFIIQDLRSLLTLVAQDGNRPLPPPFPQHLPPLLLPPSVDNVRRRHLAPQSSLRHLSPPPFHLIRHQTSFRSRINGPAILYERTTRC